MLVMQIAWIEMVLAVVQGYRTVGKRFAPLAQHQALPGRGAGRMVQCRCRQDHSLASACDSLCMCLDLARFARRKMQTAERPEERSGILPRVILRQSVGLSIKGKPFLL